MSRSERYEARVELGPYAESNFVTIETSDRDLLAVLVDAVKDAYQRHSDGRGDAGQ